jgi:deoxycytidylate deaminase
MKELKIIDSRRLSSIERKEKMLLLVEEGEIKNVTLRYLVSAAVESKLPVVVAIPEDQYKTGKRGWAKIKILSSLIPTLVGVMPLSLDDRELELQSSWGKIYRMKRVVNSPKISETREKADLDMMARVEAILPTSNCWYYPAGSVIAKDGSILAEAVSTSFDSDNFSEIPLDSRDLGLDAGERLNFGDTLHSEPLAVAKAAKAGVSLEGATIYVSKFPCLNCMGSIIGAGIKRVVFEEDSYGIGDAKVLQENGVEMVRVKK